MLVENNYRYVLLLVLVLVVLLILFETKCCWPILFPVPSRVFYFGLSRSLVLRHAFLPAEQWTRIAMQTQWNRDSVLLLALALAHCCTSGGEDNLSIALLRKDS